MRGGEASNFTELLPGESSDCHSGRPMCTLRTATMNSAEVRLCKGLAG